MKDNRKVLYVLVALALILSVAGISVGFASMSTELDIKGQAEVVPASWKIQFENVSDATILGTAEVETAPTISGATHITKYDVKLAKPGDSVTYTFDVANRGTMDAELTSYTFATPTITGTGEHATEDATIVQNNLIYTLTYADGSSINTNDSLNKGEVKTLKLTVAYNSSATELPENEVDITGMDVTFVYGQK